MSAPELRSVAAVRGWPFVVARTVTSGYRLLLVPQLLADSADRDLISRTVAPGDDVDGPAVRTVESGSGLLSLVYRSHRLTSVDGPVLDEHGRPLVMVYGFVCRGRVREVADVDLATALDAAATAYRRGAVAVAAPFALASSVAPVPVPVVAASAQHAWDGWHDRRALLAGVAAAVVAVTLAVVGWSLIRPSAPAAEVWEGRLSPVQAGAWPTRKVTVTMPGEQPGSVDDGTPCKYALRLVSTKDETVTMGVAVLDGTSGCLPAGQLELTRADTAQLRWYAGGALPVLTGTATRRKS